MNRFELARPATLSEARELLREKPSAKKSPTELRLEALFKVAWAANEGLDLERLLDSVVKIVFDHLPADRAVVCLAPNGPAGRKPEFAWKRERDGVTRVTGTIEYSRTIVNHVLETRESVLSSNAMDDTRFLAGQSIIDQSIVSAMCVPLVCQQNLLGVLHLDTERVDRAFEQADLEQLAKIGYQAAVAIENSLAHEEPRIFSESLKRLRRATQWLSSYLETEPILKEGVSTALTLLHVTKASILLVGKNGQTMQMGYAHGIRRELWDKISVAPGEGLCGLAAAENRTILCPDPATGKPPEGVVPSQRPKYKTDSFLVVPIQARTDELDQEKRVIGVLNVTDKLDGSPFTPIESQLTAILATQIGIALSNADLYEKATVCPLTRVYVRRYFDQRLAEEFERARREQSCLSLMMLDLDHFKRVNDTYGHQTGDVVLRELGAQIKSTCRPTDAAARYGGEEFAVLLPRTDLKAAAQVGESIRKAVAEHEFRVNEERLPLTISIGIGSIKEDDSSETLIKRADAALYAAKERGRNRVVVHR